MGGLFGSVTIKGNRLTDLVGQTSTVGKPIGFGYGYVLVEEPNVIWTAGIPKEHVKKKKQGKGGVKTEEYTYTLSYAVAFMQGPVHGFLTIKRGGKVVYTTDPNATIDDRAYAAKWRQKARLYLGTESQMPDATIESYVGAGRVSAHRGLVYIVVIDDDVTGEGGAVPQYEAIIIATPPDVYLTSKPYPSDLPVEGLGSSFVPQEGYLRLTHHNGYSGDLISSGLAVLDGELRSPIVKISPDINEVGSSIQFASGNLYIALSNIKIDTDSATGSLSMLSGSLAVKLIKYEYWQAESVGSTLSLPPGGYLGA